MVIAAAMHQWERGYEPGMIQGLHHFAIIVSSERSIDFYEKLGFRVSFRIDRVHDTVVLMDGYGIQIEMFIDPSHPERASRPENLGLRHLALKVDSIDEMTEMFDCGQIMNDWKGRRFVYTHDPDGLPIQFHE